MDEYIELCEQLAITEHERDTLLDILFDSIETESYINPFGIFSYLKAVYPDRFKNRMGKLYAQRD